MRLFAFSLLALATFAFANRSKSDRPTEAPVKSTTGIVFTSTDGGTTWKDVSTGLPDTVIGSRILGQANKLYVYDDDGGFFETNLVNPVQWKRRKNIQSYLEQWLMKPKFISCLSTGSRGMYAILQGEALMRETPGTDTWFPMDMPDKQIYDVEENPDGSIVISTHTGIFRTADGSATWAHVLPKQAVLDIQPSGGVLLANSPKALWRSEDGGVTWNECFAHKGDADLCAMDGGFAVLEGSSNPEKEKRLLVSKDGGKNWTIITQWNLPMGAYDIEYTNGCLFCCHNLGISRSADGGQTWMPVLNQAQTDNFVKLGLTVTGSTICAVRMRKGGC
jgi:photosystem II stability/assembly factor-like uncharacterized protein